MFYRIVDKINESSYLEILKMLKLFVDEIVIVEYPNKNNESLTVKNTLSGFHKTTKRVTNWPGTKIKTSKNNKAKANIFVYNNQTFKALKDKRSLISEEQEKDIDVFFMKNGECVFYSVIHEDIHVITNHDLKKNIDSINLELIKIPTFSLTFV